MANLRCLRLCVLLMGLFFLVTIVLWRSGMSDNTQHVSIGLRNYTHPSAVSARFQSNEQCREKTHIVYIKVPKTGSGTISSLLINFGRGRNLTFALSKSGNHYGTNPILPEYIAPIARGKHYDLLIQHATFNLTTIRNVFPKDTVIFASIREPFSQFVSSFYFYRLYDWLPKSVQSSSNETMKITTLINETFRKLQLAPLDSRLGSITYNRMSLRMGISFTHSFSAQYVREYIDTVLDPNLDLVLIQEYFDESLVLMKRRFCWSFHDILYMPYHVQNKTNTQLVYSSTILNLHKQLAVAEYMIYDHFYTKFWKTVLGEGADFFDEVRAFKSVNNRVFAFCAGAPTFEESLVISSTRWSTTFAITGQRCREMQVVIRKFVHFRRIKQMAELHRQYMKIKM